MIKKIFIFAVVVLSLFFVSAEIIKDGGVDYVSINVSEGWNLISGISFDKSDFHENTEVDMFGLWKANYWDPQKQALVEIRPIYSIAEEDAIDPLKFYSSAFWVFSSISGKLVYRASPSFIDKNLIGGHYSFYPGKNVIAINDEMFGKSINELKGICKVSSSAFWDSEAQAWVTLGLDEKIDFASRDKLVGLGISVNVSEGCEFMGADPVCGDGFCNGDETIASCEEDCKEEFFCGDGFCNGDETVGNCEEDCEEQFVCGDGFCNGDETIESCEEDCGERFFNKKNMKLFPDKSVFLVSDNDWHDVLPLVSMTTWTKQIEDESECNGVYEGPSSVCAYPSLIYHEEINRIDNNLELVKIPENIINYGYQTEGDSLFYFDSSDYLVRYNFSDGSSSDLFSYGEGSLETFVVGEEYIAAISHSWTWDWGNNTKISTLLVYDRKTKQKSVHKLEERDQYHLLTQGDLLILSAIDYSDDYSKEVRADVITTSLFRFSDSSFEGLTGIEDRPFFWGAAVISEDELLYYGVNGTNHVLSRYNLVTKEKHQSSLSHSINDIKEVGDGKFIVEVQGNSIFIFDANDGTFAPLEVRGSLFDANTDGFLYRVNEGARNVYYYDYATKDASVVSTYWGNYFDAGFYGEDKIFVRFAKKGLYDSNIYLVGESSFTEEKAFDAESIFNFIQRYGSTDLVLIGEDDLNFEDWLISQMSGNISIEKIASDNYMNYWEEFYDVVYVEDDYSMALMAATYASLINAPLVVEGSAADIDEYFVNRNIVCVGDTDMQDCGEVYDLDSLREKYVSLTGTDKIMVVNSGDLSLDIVGSMETSWQSDFASLYSKASLAAPFLASAKHEVILDTEGNSSKEFVDDLIDAGVEELFNGFEDYPGIDLSDKEERSGILTFFKNNDEIGLYWNLNLYWSVFKENSLFYQQDKKIIMYNLDSGEEKSLDVLGGYYGDNMYLNEWSLVDGNIYYKYFFQGELDSCFFGRFNVETETNHPILEVGASCWYLSFVETGGSLYVSRPSGGTCWNSGETCSSYTDCDGDSCRLSYILTKLKLNGSFESLFEVDGYVESLYGYENTIFFNKHSDLHLYNISSGGMEVVAGHRILDFDSENGLILFQSWAGYLGVYDLKTMSIEMTGIKGFYELLHLGFIPRLAEGKIHWNPDGAGVCELDNKKSCDSYDMSYSQECGYCLPLSLNSYNLDDKTIEEISFGDARYAPFWHGDDLFYFKGPSLEDYSLKGYLTIIGANNSIEAAEDMGLTGGYSNKRSLDSTEYADITGNYYPDMSVGRIQGISVSDVSSNIASSLFYDRFGYENENSFLIGNGPFDHNRAFNGLGKSIHSWAKIFEDAGYDIDCLVGVNGSEECSVFTDHSVEWVDSMKEKSLVYSGNHGTSSYVGIMSRDIPELRSGMFIADACSACASYKGDSFCSNVLRQGGVSTYGALSIGWSGNHIYEETLEGVYLENLTIGESFAKSFVFSPTTFMTTLLGDPTFKPIVKYNISEELEWQW